MLICLSSQGGGHTGGMDLAEEIARLNLDPTTAAHVGQLLARARNDAKQAEALSARRSV